MNSEKRRKVDLPPIEYTKADWDTAKRGYKYPRADASHADTLWDLACRERQLLEALQKIATLEEERDIQAGMLQADEAHVESLEQKISTLEQQLKISKSAYETNLKTLEWNHQQSMNEWDNERFSLEQQLKEAKR